MATLLLWIHLLLEMASSLALFSGPDRVQLQESPVTDFPRWLDNRYDVQGQPGTGRWHPESGFLSCSLLPLLLNARLPRIFPTQQQQNTIRFPCSSLCFTQPDTLPEFASSYLQQQQKALKYWNAPRTIPIFDKIVYYRDIYSNMAPQTLQNTNIQRYSVARMYWAKYI